MMTILAQRQSYVEFERMDDQQNIHQQLLGLLQEESLRVICELATTQRKVKQETHETKEDIVEIEEAIIKEFLTAKEASQKFIEALRSMKWAQAAWDEPHVSVGGMLDKHYRNNIHKNHKYGICV
jgi:hypothetical protein